jgi:1-acyl-sn-glycerol-3-phosphate acyltransferase
MLARLGLYKLWREDPEVAWPFIRVWMKTVIRMLSPTAGYGIERMPLEGGAVLAANHFSGLDPPAIGIYSTRTVYYMTKIELLDIPVAGELLRMAGAFAVRRGEGDRDAIRVARWLLQEGHVVGMFMEGTRQKHGHPGPVHSGAAMIAMQEGVPVVPCGIDSFGWSPRTRRPHAVVFGDPIELDGLARNGGGYKEGAQIIERELLNLWRLAAQAVADGFPEELPDGARRRRPLRLSEAHPLSGTRPWPTEPWAKGPLGPLYRETR